MSLYGAKRAYQNQRAMYLDMARGSLIAAANARKHGDIYGARCHLRNAERQRKRIVVMNENIRLLADCMADAPDC